MILCRLVSFNFQDKLSLYISIDQKINALKKERIGFDYMREMAMMNVMPDRVKYLTEMILKKDQEIHEIEMRSTFKLLIPRQRKQQKQEVLLEASAI